MDNLTRVLREADPVRGSDGLAPDDAQQIRRAMLAAMPAPSAISVWRRPLAIAAVVALMIGLGGIAGDRTARDRTTGVRGVAPANTPGESPDARRQLQFSTPGGTRIIWVFDENLRLQEPMP